MDAYRIEMKSTVDGEVSEIITYGDVFREHGGTVVFFSDPDGDTEVRIVVGEEMVSVVRSGEIETVMTFEKGRTLSADLVTEYGTLSFPYYVDRVFTHVGERGVRVILEYASGETRYEVDVKCEKALRDKESREEK